jgi:hypothetical protein
MHSTVGFIPMIFLGVLGAAIIWCGYARMKARRSGTALHETKISPMSESDIRKIEQTLGVALPPAYTKFLGQERPPEMDGVTIFSDPALIISRTTEYREGFGGAPPWPREFVCVGDEDDACPYVLDCSSGMFVQTDHGNLDKKPLVRFASFADFIAEQRGGEDEPA